MSKRKRKNTKNSSKLLKYIAYILAFIALVLSGLIAGYYFGYKDAKVDFAKQQKVEKQKRLDMLKKIQNATSKEKKSVNTRLKEVLKKETPTYATASHEYDDITEDVVPKPLERKKVVVTSKPKLAIIIDDVSVKSQINAIKSLNIPLNMSFLPPSSRHPNSAKLAAKESFYMVHLPMEAKSFTKEEPFTLRVSDSQELIADRIAKLKKLFPKVTYINNHTGSKFTSDEAAMNRLIYVLKKQHIRFIDSRTTADTKAPKVMKSFGYAYMARDVFLDHHSDKAYIKEQIKKAIQLAKRHGSAIAIGHPHANTILALHESKNLLQDVELVYINKLY